MDKNEMTLTAAFQCSFVDKNRNRIKKLRSVCCGLFHQRANSFIIYRIHYFICELDGLFLEVWSPLALPSLRLLR